MVHITLEPLLGAEMKHRIVTVICLSVVACACAFAAGAPVTAPFLQTPEPSSILMMATALAGGAGYLAWKRRRKQ